MRKQKTRISLAATRALTRLTRLLSLTRSLSLTLFSPSADHLPFTMALLFFALSQEKQQQRRQRRMAWRVFFFCAEKREREREGLCIPLYHIYDLLPLTERESRSRTLTPD